MYRVKISPRAKAQLRILKTKYKLSISLITEDLKENPFVGKPLGRELTGKYSYRIGVYRIIYRINTKANLVEIITAGHRSVVYN